MVTAPNFARPRSVQDPADWPHIPRECPELPFDLDYTDRDAVTSWIYRLKPIETSDIHVVEAAIWEQLKRNAHQYQGGRQILAINGEAALGKTVAVSTALLRVYDALQASPPEPKIAGAKPEHYPVVYIADQGGSYLKFLTSIAEFVQCPVKIKSSSKADHLLNHLALILPDLGTRLIVVDDAHMLRRVGAARDLTDNIKRAVDRLPVSFVFVGAGLESSALMKNSGEPGEYSAADQITRRIKLISLARLDSDSRQKAWHNRLNNLVSEIEKIPGWDWSAFRDQTFRENLFSITQGSTGWSFELIRETAAEAINLGDSPTVDHLLKVALKVAR